jgi:hypothetical protein
VKLSDLSDQDWFNRLSARRNANLRAIADWWAYYDNTQPMYHVMRLLSDQDDRFPALSINWCRKYVRSIDGRSNLEGFGYVGQDSIDERMQKIMLRNELDLHQSLNNVATLVTSTSYGMVGPSADGAVVTIESPDSMAVEVDPRTREVRTSLNFWSSDSEGATDDLAVLQLPDSRGGSRLVEFELGKPVGEQRMKWMAGPAKIQASGLIPVVPFLNQARWGKPTSQLVDLKPIVDAANLIATEMLGTAHHHAMPRMIANNVAEALFFNEDGTPNREALKSATGAVWIIPAETDDRGNTPENAPVADIKQLPASDLRNFHDTLSLLARVGSGLCDLTPTDFGFGVSDNPPSADSINASKHERLLGIERFNRQQGAGYERLMRYALAVEGSDPGKRLIEAKFRNPATPTQQSMADAAVKTYSTGISDLYQARVDYGYTTTQIQAMEKREVDTLVRQDAAFNDANKPLTDVGAGSPASGGNDAVDNGNA